MYLTDLLLFIYIFYVPITLLLLLCNINFTCLNLFFLVVQNVCPSFIWTIKLLFLLFLKICLLLTRVSGVQGTVKEDIHIGNEALCDDRLDADTLQSCRGARLLQLLRPRDNRIIQFIYTTIAGVSSYFLLQNLTKISLCAPNSTAITAYIFLRLHLTNPLLLDRSLFAFVLCFTTKNHRKTTNAVKAYRPA